MSGGGYFENKYLPEGDCGDGFFGTSGEADPNAMSGVASGSSTATGTLTFTTHENAAIGGVSERWLKKRKRRGGGGKYYRLDTQAAWERFLRDIGELREIAELPAAPVVDLVALKAKLADEEERLDKRLSAVRESGTTQALAAERSALAAVKKYVAIAEAAQNDDDEEVMLILALAA